MSNSNIKTLSAFLGHDAIRKQMSMVLPKHMTADSMVRIALTAASRTPKLLQCSPESIGLSLMKAAESGLEPDGWDGHLVPFKNKGKYECQFIADYKGLVKLCYQSELVLEVDADAVYENDDFAFSRGTDSFIRHIATNEEDTGELCYAWAMAKIRGGGAPFVVLNRRQVMKHKKASPAARSEYSPWNNPETEPDMWKKTAVRVLCKLLPRSPKLQNVLKTEIAAETGGEIIDGALVNRRLSEKNSKDIDPEALITEAAQSVSNGNGNHQDPDPVEAQVEPSRKASEDQSPPPRRRRRGGNGAEVVV